MILGLGAGAALRRRRGARRVSPQQPDLRTAHHARSATRRSRRRAHVRRRPQPRRDAARFSTRSRRADVKATFFILGRHAEQWPELVARVADEGHSIGNHGYYHRKLHFKSPAYVRDDLERGTRRDRARVAACIRGSFARRTGFGAPG